MVEPEPGGDFGHRSGVLLVADEPLVFLLKIVGLLLRPPRRVRTDHDHQGDDPHIWTAPSNVKIIAQNIYNALIDKDPENRDYYKRNLDIFLAAIDETDRQIIHILSSLENGEKFMVFHPSWGYFADTYGLLQIPLEIEGKHPKPAQLKEVIEYARQNNISVIFVQPQFSAKSAEVIARGIGGQVVVADPLAENWAQKIGHTGCPILDGIQLQSYPFFFSMVRYQTFIPPP